MTSIREKKINCSKLIYILCRQRNWKFFYFILSINFWLCPYACYRIWLLKWNSTAALHRATKTLRMKMRVDPSSVPHGYSEHNMALLIRATCQKRAIVKLSRTKSNESCWFFKTQNLHGNMETWYFKYNKQQLWAIIIQSNMRQANKSN